MVTITKLSVLKKRKFVLKTIPPKVRRIKQMERVEFVVARTRIPQFRLGTCTTRFSTPPIFGRRFTFNVPYPCVQVRQAELALVATITFPSIFNGRSVRQIVINCAEQAKDDAIEQILFILPFTTLSGGAAIFAAIRQGFTTFVTSFRRCIQNRVQGLSPTVNGVLRTTPLTAYRDLFSFIRAARAKEQKK